jgi:hypothetical protein
VRSIYRCHKHQHTSHQTTRVSAPLFTFSFFSLRSQDPSQHPEASTGARRSGRATGGEPGGRGEHLRAPPRGAVVSSPRGAAMTSFLGKQRCSARLAPPRGDLGGSIAERSSEGGRVPGAADEISGGFFSFFLIFLHIFSKLLCCCFRILFCGIFFENLFHKVFFLSFFHKSFFKILFSQSSVLKFFHKNIFKIFFPQSFVPMFFQKKTF